MKLKVPIYDATSLSILYSPGVGACCMKIKDEFKCIYKYTNIGNSVAIITDCTDYKHYGEE